MRYFEPNVITAIAASISALVAIAAVAVLIWQVHFTARIQALLHLDSLWMSDSMRAARKKAAASLVQGKPSAEVDRVLDFFETIAGLFLKPRGLFRTRVLPDDWARHTFYWSAVCYWSKSRDYIEAVRSRPTENKAWIDLCELMPRWSAAERGPPTQIDIDGFLDDERND